MLLLKRFPFIYLILLPILIVFYLTTLINYANWRRFSISFPSIHLETNSMYLLLLLVKSTYYLVWMPLPKWSPGWLYCSENVMQRIRHLSHPSLRRLSGMVVNIGTDDLQLIFRFASVLLIPCNCLQFSLISHPVSPLLTLRWRYSLSDGNALEGMSDGDWMKPGAGRIFKGLLGYLILEPHTSVSIHTLCQLSDRPTEKLKQRFPNNQ